MFDVHIEPSAQVARPLNPLRDRDVPIEVKVDSRSQRQCEFCKVMLRPERYERHLKKAHANGEAVDAMRQPRMLLSVHGIGGSRVFLVANDLSAMPQHTFTTFHHGTPVRFDGVLLFDILAKVTIPTGDKFLNTAGWYYMLAEALDGNRAVFAWAELDSTFMENSVYVVTKRDGNPLSADSDDVNSPFRGDVNNFGAERRWLLR